MHDRACTDYTDSFETTKHDVTNCIHMKKFPTKKLRSTKKIRRWNDFTSWCARPRTDKLVTSHDWPLVGCMLNLARESMRDCVLLFGLLNDIREASHGEGIRRASACFDDFLFWHHLWNSASAGDHVLSDATPQPLRMAWRRCPYSSRLGWMATLTS